MNSEVVEKRIEEISTICEELGHIIPQDGWTDYAVNLLGRLQKLAVILDDEDERADGMYEAFKNAWITTENNHKIHIGDDGEPDKGNPYVLEAIKGAMESTDAKYRKEGMRCENPVEFDRPGSITTDKVGRKVTHFNHDEDTMKVTKQVKIDDEFAGKKYKICREPIEHLTVFAGEGAESSLDVAEYLADQVGGSKGSWKHVKGIGTVVGEDGKKRKVDIHWFESPESGQVGWKIKEFLEDMDESQIYWKR